MHYDGKNGHPYSSIGRYLIEKGLLAADKVSMGALENWLRADPERGKKVMWQNASYVFFRELKGADAKGPLGAMKRPLTPGRSLAVDPSHHALGPADLRQRRGHEARRKIRGLQPADGRPGRGLGHQGTRARRHLLRLRRCGRQARRRHQAPGKFIVLLPNEMPARAEAAPRSPEKARQ